MLSSVEGHEQAGHRPVLIVSDDRYTMARKLAIVFPLTTNDRLKRPLTVELPSLTGRRSFALPGQVRSLSVTRLGNALGTVTAREIDACLTAMLHICGRVPKRTADNDA
jgi:mRNA-degrading endonuclease toxin of MazEF toxin-antitoxin module